MMRRKGLRGGVYVFPLRYPRLSAYFWLCALRSYVRYDALILI